MQVLFTKIYKAISHPQLVKTILLQQVFLRRIIGIDKKIIYAYFRQYSVKKLHLGCGEHKLAGWINTDAHPLEGVMYLDVKKIFPFQASTFDYIFSEHLLEHMPYANGLDMFLECYRVLKPGGRIRLATPDLHFLIALCTTNTSDLQKRYIKWMIDSFMPEARQYDPTFVLNYYVRNWEHHFIYDKKTLADALEQTGFTCITKCKVGDSGDAVLRGLENQARMPEGFLDLETIVLEAVKPG